MKSFIQVNILLWNIVLICKDKMEHLLTIMKRASWTSKDNVWSAPQMLSQSSQVDLFLFCCPGCYLCPPIALVSPMDDLSDCFVKTKYKTNTKYKYTNINTRQADVIVFLYLSLLWHCLFLLFMIVRGSKLDTQFLPMSSLCASSYRASVVFCPFLVLVFLSLTLHSSNRSINQINTRHKVTLERTPTCKSCKK